MNTFVYFKKISIEKKIIEFVAQLNTTQKLAKIKSPIIKYKN